MKCPNCDETLLMTMRQNVEIDYCPKCRGIWLDKGELDKLLEYSETQNTDVSYNRHQQQEYDRKTHSQEYDRDDRYSDRDSYPQHRKKKKSFLSDLFDFD